MKISTDSRTIKKGEYFVPVKGENFDGRDYINNALEKGAKGVIEEQTLYEIASQKLQKIDPEIIAITGSVGKSTMRDFIFSVFSSRYKTCKGFLNTKLGLAVNIVNDLKSGDEYFIAETGMDYQGELLVTGGFLNPDCAVITNVSESHMQKLGSLEAIIKAKTDIVYTVKTNGTVFLNWDNINIRSIINNIPPDKKVVKYGFREDSGYNPEHINKIINKESAKYKSLRFEDLSFKFIGSHNLLNALGAFAVSYEYGIRLDNIIEQLQEVQPPKGRLNILSGPGGSVLFDDTYNASPQSSIEAINAVNSYYIRNNLTGRKIAVFGGMRELGDYEDEGHKIVGDRLSDSAYDVVILVGDLAKKIAESSKLTNNKVCIFYFLTPSEAADAIKSEICIKSGDAVLFKSSRVIELEKCIEKLLKLN